MVVFRPFLRPLMPQTRTVAGFRLGPGLPTRLISVWLFLQVAGGTEDYHNSLPALRVLMVSGEPFPLKLAVVTRLIYVWLFSQVGRARMVVVV